jgi:hypothetical protein
MVDKKSPAPPVRLDEAPPLMIAELLYEHPPIFDTEAFRKRLAVELPRARMVTGGDKASVTLVAHENHLVKFPDGRTLPAQTAVMLGSPFIAERFEGPLAQTWGWAEAREVVGRCGYQILVSELMTHTLDRKVRLELFLATLCEVLAVAPPDAVFCQSADRIIEPEAIVRARLATDLAERFAPFLNVRFFRPEGGAPDDALMDTRGLTAVGLPDLQIHFQGLEPTEVAAHLYNCGFYLFENGDVIEDGHTIQGLTPNQKWICQHEESLAPPTRAVVDFDTGEAEGAG